MFASLTKILRSGALQSQHKQTRPTHSQHLIKRRKYFLSKSSWALITKKTLPTVSLLATDGESTSHS